MPQIANVSQETQYNIFRRDGFACRRCKKKVPSVVLYVGYETPPEDGGTDDVDNLITLCYDCSGGHPLEMLSERRKQLEMMLQWQRTLKDFKEDMNGIVIDYVNGKIGPGRSLNNKGKKDVISALKISNIDIVLNTIDDVFDKYVEYDDNDNIDPDSINKFVMSIGSHLFVNSQPPVERQLYLMRGAYRKMIYDFDERQSLVVLKKYVKALREAGWSDARILRDLKEELCPELDKCDDWEEWKEFIEKWTSDIKAWDAPAPTTTEPRRSLNEDSIETFTRMDTETAFDFIDIMCFLYKGFPEYSEDNGYEFKKELLSCMKGYIVNLRDRYLAERDIPQYDEHFTHDWSERVDYDRFFSLEDLDAVGELGFGSRVLLSEGRFTSLFEEALSEFDYNNRNFDYATGVKSLNYAIDLTNKKIQQVEVDSLQLPF